MLMGYGSVLRWILTVSLLLMHKCAYACPANQSSQNGSVCGCNAGYYRQTTPPVRCDYTFNVSNFIVYRILDDSICQVGTVNVTADQYVSTTTAATVSLRPVRIRDLNLYFSLDLNLYFPSDDVKDEIFTLHYNGSTFVPIQYLVDWTPPATSIETTPGVWTGRHFVYTISNMTLVVTDILQMQVATSTMQLTMQYDYTIAHPIQTFTCLSCNELSSLSPLYGSTGCLLSTSTTRAATTTSTTTLAPTTSTTRAATTTSTTTTTLAPTTSTTPNSTTTGVNTTMTTEYQVVFTATLAYDSPSAFTDTLRTLYKKGVVATIAGLNPETDYVRVLLAVMSTSRRRLLSGTVSVPTTVSLDSAEQLESAALSLNEDALRAALGKYNIGLTSMSAVQMRGGRNGTSSTPLSETTPSPSPTPVSSPGLSVVAIGVIGGVGGLILIVIIFLCVKTQRLTKPRQAAQFAWVKIDRTLA